MKWIQLVKLLAPTALAFVPHADKIAPVIPTIIDGIQEAEAIKGATGEQKKAHVLNLVSDAVDSLNASGAAHLDPVEVQATAANAIDTTVGVINVVHKAHQVVPAGVLLAPQVSTPGQ